MVINSDGSKKTEGTRVGVCRMWHNRERGGRVWGKSYKMGKEMEIMDTKMVGIKKAIE